jgi:quercetin dioxygenase-like cupin family protein
MIAPLIAILSIAALTELQVDKLIIIIELCLKAFQQGVTVLWVTLSPVLLGYLAYRQAMNRKALDENTKATNENKGTLTDISESQRILRLLAQGRKTTNGHEVHTVVTLPGFEYEEFQLSTGAKTYWKQEPSETGKRVRFIVTGAAKMAFHSHEVEEVLLGVKGVLLVDAPDGIHTVGPGEQFTSTPGQVHSVEFTEYGEILAEWVGQADDHLKIIIYTEK